MFHRHKNQKDKTQVHQMFIDASPQQRIILFVIAFAAVGSIILIAVHASTPTIAVEPENSTIKSPASSGSDGNASRGAYLQFNKTSPVTDAGYNKLAFYPCDASNTTFGAQQVQCWKNLGSWLGRNTSPIIPYVVLMTDGGSPSLMSGNGSGAVAVPGGFQTLNPKPTIVISVPLAFGTDGCGNTPRITTCFDNVAAGRYDNDYRQLLQYFLTAGYTSNNLIIRLGWEYDGNWMPWSAKNNPSQFVAAFRHVHTTLRAIPGLASLKFDLAGDAGQPFGQNIWDSGNQFYPGDGFVDIIGMDTYYGAISNPVFNTSYLPSLHAQENFAKSHGKTVSYPEWGQKEKPDTPSFIQDMGSWYSGLPASGAGSLEYQAYFNTDTHDVEAQNGAYALYDAVHNQPLQDALNSENTFKTLFGGVR